MPYKATVCCVPGCSRKSTDCKANLGFFKIPKNEDKKKEWFNAMRLNEQQIANLSHRHRVCAMHFTKKDFYMNKNHKQLRRKAVPSIFKHDESQNSSRSLLIINHQIAGMAAIVSENKTLKEKVQKLEAEITKLKKHEVRTNLLLFSGFASYSTFRKLYYKVILPTQKVKYCSKISLENQLFLTLMKLKTSYSFINLGEMFKIPAKLAFDIFLTCLKSIHDNLNYKVNIWPSKIDVLENKTAVMDCVEFFKLKLFKKDASQGYSKCKSLLIVDDDGFIIYASSLVVGETCDKEFVKTNILRTSDDTDHSYSNKNKVLADRGFKVGTSNNGGIAVERVVQRLKKFKILDSVVPVCLMGSVNQIFQVCCMLLNYNLELRTDNESYSN